VKGNNRKVFKRLEDRVSGVIHNLLRPFVRRIVEQMLSEAECGFDEEDIPDCDSCEHQGECAWKSGAVYEPPPGFLLIRPGPPPGSEDLN